MYATTVIELRIFYSCLPYRTPIRHIASNSPRRHLFIFCACDVCYDSPKIANSIRVCNSALLSVTLPPIHHVGPFFIFCAWDVCYYSLLEHNTLDNVGSLHTGDVLLHPEGAPRVEKCRRHFPRVSTCLSFISFVCYCI